MATALAIPWEVLERDYLLSWILAGISRTSPLRETLIFKGGTALKKCWFGDYRFSEDLDFSGTDQTPSAEAMAEAMRQACATAAGLLDEYAPVEISCQRYTEKSPHPGRQEAFTIRARFPWQGHIHTRVMVEVSMDEKVIRPTVLRKVIHDYGEPFDAQIMAYSLEEVVAEKLRAILQQAEKLQSRGWSRSRARDYYDLWRVLGTYRDQMELSGFQRLLSDKCAVRNVAFKGTGDFFQENMIAYVEKTWEQWLGPLVPALPPCRLIIGELRSQVDSLLASG